jgi:hypothetical protein
VPHLEKKTALKAKRISRQSVEKTSVQMLKTRRLGENNPGRSTSHLIRTFGFKINRHAADQDSLLTWITEIHRVITRQPLSSGPINLTITALAKSDATAMKSD